MITHLFVPSLIVFVKQGRQLNVAIYYCFSLMPINALDNQVYVMVSGFLRVKLQSPTVLYNEQIWSVVKVKKPRTDKHDALLFIKEMVGWAGWVLEKDMACRFC